MRSPHPSPKQRPFCHRYDVPPPSIERADRAAYAKGVVPPLPRRACAVPETRAGQGVQGAWGCPSPGPLPSALLSMPAASFVATGTPLAGRRSVAAQANQPGCRAAAFHERQFSTQHEGNCTFCCPKRSRHVCKALLSAPDMSITDRHICYPVLPQKHLRTALN